MDIKPRIFAVSDGRAGIARQAIALATAINDIIPSDIRIIELQPEGPQVMLPPTMWHDPIGALPKEQALIFQEQLPDIWIANGRRSIAYSLWVQKKHKNTIVVQIQDPKIDSKNFDFIVSPKHDNVKGANVFETLGGLVYYSAAQIEDTINVFPDIAHESRDKVLVILGGNSKTHTFNTANAQNLLNSLQSENMKDKCFWISASRRTPPQICQMFRKFANENGHKFFENQEMDGPNPYLAWLVNADYAIITEDSANMISDAAFFGLPIHLARLSGKSRKFETLHKSFIDAGAAIWWRGTLQKLTYELPKYVEIAAKAIVKTYEDRQITTS